MSVQDISKTDFDWHVEQYRSDKECWEKEFLQTVKPELIRAFYRGKKQVLRDYFGSVSEDSTQNMALSLLFASENTFASMVLPQNPKPIVVALRDTPPERAALMSSLLRRNMEMNNAKEENREAIMNARFFGLGWKKVGYRVDYPPKEIVAQEPETITEKAMNLFKSVTGSSEAKPVPMESKATAELAYDEGVFNSSESPMNIYLDHKADLRNGNVISHVVPRTLYNLMVYGNYDEDGLKEAYDKMKRLKGTRFDSRSMDVVLVERHIKQKNGIWVLSWIEGHDRPLQYERCILNTAKKYKQNMFQFVPLSLTYEPGVRYPVSYMKVSSQVMDKIDKIVSLYLDIVSRARNMLIINKNDMEKGTIDAIEDNRIGLIALANKPINPGTYAHLTSPSVSNDLPNLINILQQALTQIVGIDQQMTSGTSENDTLGQDELARSGTKIREGGIKDAIREFVIRQFKIEGCLMQEYAEGELQGTVLPQDYQDQAMQMQNSQPQPYEFMTMQNPISAKANLGGEYDYDMNVEEAIRPDSRSIRDGLMQILEAGANPLIKSALLEGERPKRIRVDLVAEEIVKTYGQLGNPQRYIEELDSMQVAAIQAKEFLMSGKSGVGSQPKLSGNQSKGQPEVSASSSGQATP